MRHARFRIKATDEVVEGSCEEEHFLDAAGRRFAREEVELLAPVLPSKIICVGKNYLDHAAEMGGSVPERPLLFFKPPSAVIGPEAEIHLPASSRVDYEGEIAVVIGRRCRHVPRARAAEVIWGVTAFNDVTDREAQSWETNWVRAKGFDTSACLGPWLVPWDELPHPLEVVTRVDGERRQQGRTDQLAFPIPFLIEVVSGIMTLERGDVIATGTPAGVGPLRPGDVVEVEVSGVGTLRNRVAGA